MKKQLISLEDLMGEILNQWPITIHFFLENHMACVGCGLSRFDTLAEAFDAYNLPAEVMLKMLNATLDDQSLIEYSTK
jgi:hybrid cluster-associated redox disulfide protein